MKIVLAALAAFLVFIATAAAAPSPSIVLSAQMADGFPAYPGNDWVSYRADVSGSLGKLDLFVHHRCYDVDGNEVYGGLSTGSSYGIGDERLYWEGKGRSWVGTRAFAVYAPGVTPFPAYCVGWIYAGPNPSPATPLSNVVTTSAVP